MFDSEAYEMVRIYADWKIWGDVEAREHIADLLSAAYEDGKISNYEILAATDGALFGLMYVSFYVDTKFRFEDLIKPKKEARRLLNEIVSDTDVDVRWIKHLPKV